MNTDQTNRINMFKTVREYLNQNNAVWNGMPTMVAAVAQFNGRIVGIDQAAQKQEAPTFGATLDKETARNTLEDVLFLMSEALGVLAHNTNDGPLRALTDISRSALDGMTDEDLSNRATNVLTQVQGRAGELEEMNVTLTMINEFVEARNNFNAAKVQPRTVAANRKAQTESLPSLIRDASGLLRNQIDRLVNLSSRSHPDFVAGYRGARVIVNRPATLTTQTPNPPPPPNP
ncbi:MAG TPA: hypothetical protein VGW76_08790 [Pyrinomonadaceae bacterium]|nr:hypothetical protein [Pyrinomonadaceae bacterium]